MKPKPKFLHLAEQLEQEIISGNIPPGYRLPGEREIAVKHNISHLTVNKAVANLVAKGLLERRGRHGTFVAEPKKISHLNVKTAALMTDLQPERHNLILPTVHPLLQSQGFSTVLIDTSVPEKIEPQIKAIAPPAVLIAHVNWGMPFEIFERLPGKPKVIIINRPDKPIACPHSTIVWDYRAGALAAVRALAANGRRRIAALVQEPTLCWQMRQLHEGLDDAERDLDLPPIERIAPHKVPSEHLAEYFAGRQLPDGIFALMDYYAMLAVKSFRAAGVRIPEDISVVGYNNTPWAEIFDLTSVSINPEKTAEAVNTLLAADTGLEIWVEPRLVCRASCQLQDGNAGRIPGEKPWS